MLANLPSRTISGPVPFKYRNFLIISAFSAACFISSWCPVLRVFHYALCTLGPTVAVLLQGNIWNPLRHDGDGDGPCPNSAATPVPAVTLVVLCVCRRRRKSIISMCVNLDCWLQNYGFRCTICF